VLLVLVAGGLAFYWTNSAQTQAVAAVAGFLATILLIGVTREYVRTNQETLKLLAAQWEQQHTPTFRFGVKASNGYARVWVANLGVANFMVTKVVVAKKQEKPLVRHKHRIVTPGHVTGFDLPEELWRDEPIFCDINVKLEYQCFGKEGVSEGRSYNLLVSNGKVIKIRKGMGTVWAVNCPKCKRWDGMAMRTENLTNFEEADARQKQMEEELSATCPEHQSQWMLTMENVKAHRRADFEE